MFSFDALTNAIACESIEKARWFHSNHIFYPFAGVLWYKVERFFGYAGFSIYSLERFNSFLVSTGLGIFGYVVSIRIGIKKAVILTATIGSTYAVWHYAVDGRAVGASFSLSLLVIVLMLIFNEREQLTAVQRLSLIIASSLYIFFHGLAIFHFFAVFFWLHARFKDRRGAVVYLLSVAVIVLGTYSFIYFLVVKPFINVAMMKWMIGYAAHGGSGEMLESAYWSKSVGVFLQGLWQGWHEAFLKPMTGGDRRFISQLAGLIAVVFFLSSLVQWKQKSPQERALLKSFLLWTGLTTLFLGFWSPGQEGFRLHILAPVFVTMALLLDKKEKSWTFLALFGALLFCLNLSWTMAPSAAIKNNDGYQRLKEIREKLQPQDVLLSANGEYIPGVEVLRPYFFPEIQGGSVNGWLFAYQEESLDALAHRLDNQMGQGHNLFFTQDLYEERIQRQIEEQFGLGTGSLAGFLRYFSVQKEIELGSGIKIYQMQAGKI